MKAGTFFGLIVILLGLAWLARDMGWLPSIPLWPLLLIILGLWIILRRAPRL